MRFRSRKGGLVTVYSGSWIALLIWVMVLSFLVQGVLGSVELEEEASQVCPSRALQVWTNVREAGDLEIASYGCDGSVLWEVAKAVLFIGVWEACKALRSCFRAGNPQQIHVGCQTVSAGIICLPLSDDVPCRARILYCLWRANFKVDHVPGRDSVGIL